MINTTNIWETLDKLNENTSSDIENDTDYSLETLEQMEWRKVGIETSDFSTMTAVTYETPDGKLVKKVFSDGYTAYYESAT